MNFRFFNLAIMATSVLSVSAWGHHSQGNYQMTEYTHLSGTVTQVHFMNPHSWLYVEVMDSASQPAVWVLEAKGIGQLARLGVTEANIKVGDSISARCHQLRDGSNGCLLGFLTSEDGIEREWD
jgi:hypothetical protein